MLWVFSLNREKARKLRWGDLYEGEWHILEDLLLIECKKRGRGSPPRKRPFDYQRHILAATVWCAMARRGAQIRKLEQDLSPVPALLPVY